MPPDIVDEIVERTDGVPLFVEELTKAVVEAGTDHGYVSISAVPPSSLAVPATLHASLLGRLDRLGPAANNVAQVGAAIGRDFFYELLAAAAPLADPELQDALRSPPSKPPGNQSIQPAPAAIFLEPEFTASARRPTERLMWQFLDIVPRRWTERIQTLFVWRGDRSHFPLLDRRPENPGSPKPGFSL